MATAFWGAFSSPELLPLPFLAPPSARVGATTFQPQTRRPEDGHRLFQVRTRYAHVETCARALCRECGRANKP
jgi:hypothetical protein